MAWCDVLYAWTDIVRLGSGDSASSRKVPPDPEAMHSSIPSIILQGHKQTGNVLAKMKISAVIRDNKSINLFTKRIKFQ